MEVLFFYTLFAFLFVCPDVKNAAQMDMHFLPAVAFKSFIIFLAWMCSFKSDDRVITCLCRTSDAEKTEMANGLQNAEEGTGKL